MGIRVYRCFNCKKPLTEIRVLEGSGCACGSRRVTPSNPLISETPFLLLEVIWRWFLKKIRS